MHGESGYPRQNIVLVMASNSGGLSPGPLEPHDTGSGQLDFQLPGVAGIMDRDRKEGGSRGTVSFGHRPGREQNRQRAESRAA